VDALSHHPSHQLQALSAATTALTLVIKDLYPGDQDYGAIHIALLNPSLPMDTKTTKTQLKCYELIDGLFYLQATLETDLPRLCNPRDTDIHHTIIASCHNSATSGHFSFDKTYDLVCCMFIWPKMVDHIKTFVTTCDACQRIKSSSQLPAGLLQPLPTPGQQWEQMTMDFIIKLPPTQDGYNAIIVFVD
jgi:hypothetical protein